MTRKNISAFFLMLLFTAVPSFLSYLASSTLIFDVLIRNQILSQGINVELVQDYCLWIGIALSAIFLSFNLFATNLRKNKAMEERNLLIKMNKNILATSLSSQLKSEQLDFDIRIFIPKYSFLYTVAKTFHIRGIRKRFVIKNIDLIAEEGTTKNLQFEVSPNQEGLVGICYHEKAVVYDDNLETTNSLNYNLGKNQISRTSNSKWCICCPIHNLSDDVVAIIALDGKSKIIIDKSNENFLREQLIAFSRMLFDSVPQLFKR